MAELLEKEQILSIVPQDYRNSNKGKVLDINKNSFSLELFHEPDGIAPQKIMEFYSSTKNGMLYFTSSAAEINGNTLTVLIPRKHRFLQRRALTRIKFAQGLNLKSGDKSYEAGSIDLSSGGMKLKTKESLSIDSEYSLSINLLEKSSVECNYQPMKIEKNSDGSYTLSGRFQNLTNADKMKLTQFCMRKNIENLNR
jgi:c-di-GMP-binding flagellar brake protein YcgR